MTTTSPVEKRSQAFLTGPRFFLRPAEPTDAVTATRWHDSPFPFPAEVIEERLREQLGANLGTSERRLLLLICRQRDALPVVRSRR